ncbi:phosphate ABC transporter permease PstA [Ruminococcus sp.]|jgi:phosphate transport system permease protein|uniref:phosphate ABC transporter permease PstA n=1 Tax=Ruminococcus sp. TaxID=41978 RepID=UPI0026328ADA|nr:phosphate ABC transporter permease PstA [Ruminococcus sp.]MCI2112676.1 phosphate ABC transporter permease PstA [Ruminococcus sp.]MDD6989634.1 phosphate ABC transporter permease PstA [Ruminococcus sp.]MDY6202522.1 phosphate ABC transporter permease PstA [Ruminococcus sp.]
MADNNTSAVIDEIKPINKVTFKQRMISYKRKPLSLVMLLLVALAAVLSAAALVFIIVYVLVRGIPNLTPELFALTYDSDNVSCMPSIINTIVLTLLTLLIAVPFGIGAAIYLAEYAKKGNKLVKVIRTMAETLAGIPSIVYGLFGMLFFVYALNWGYSLFAGAFTLAIMVLPTIMRTTEEALLTVPDSYREGSYGLGAGKLRTIVRIILPSAMPGILAGIILAVGRIVGETAALIYTYGSATGYATGLFNSGRSLAVHMYVLTNEGLHTDQAWGTAVVLLVLVFGINTLSAFIAKKLGNKKG